MGRLELSRLPISVKEFVLNEIELSANHTIATVLVNKPFVQMGGLKVNGYFSDADMILAVATKKPIEQWLPTFVHETCHRDQYTEHAKVWGQCVRGCDPVWMLDLWMDEVVELKPITLQQMINGALKVELDCEKRSVKKIKRHRLPIDAKEYIQKANSYLYFYQMLAVSRKWYTIGQEPYNVPEVWKDMPTTFDGDYTKLPTAYKKLFAEHCFSGLPR